jgi:hypothetical protein
VLHSPEVAYTIGHLSPPAGYRELDPLAGRSVHAGPRLPDMAANTARDIAGTRCALVMFPAEPLADIHEYARLILHESFHAFQLEGLSGVPLSDYCVMQRYPESDPENNTACIVENRILCAALNALSSPGEAADCMSIAGKFISVRQARHARLESEDRRDIATYEQRAEFTEGTPTYVEVVAGKPVAEIISTLEQCNIAGKWAASKRFYATGAAIALLLDRLMPIWHKRLAEGGHTLQSLLTEAVGRYVPDVEQVLHESDYPEILAAETARERERKAKIDGMLEELESGPGVKVDIEVPAGAFTMYDPTNVINIELGMRLHTTISGFRGANGIVVDISRLCLENSKSRVLTLRLPVQPHPEKAADGTCTFSAEGLSISAPKGFECLCTGHTYRVRFEI